ncbi:MAG: TatD family hydrolase [Opitutales bacterium]|nr:TatD family hydrolase [Opitutales bacterium]
MDLPPGPLTDAHCHLHDDQLRGAGFSVERWLCDEAPADWRGIVNGTSPADWEAVLALARTDARILPQIGLHPWRVRERPRDWASRLETLLIQNPQTGVGECGLDKWIEGADITDQTHVFKEHLSLAHRLNRPLTVHCLRAWGPLRQVLEGTPNRPPAFLLHGYGGPPELVPVFVDLGAYFSYSPSFADPRKTRARAAFRIIPRERLLVETDAPSMPPPADTPGALLLKAREDGPCLSHPGNLAVSLRSLAGLRGEDTESLREALEQNLRDLLKFLQ